MTPDTLSLDGKVAIVTGSGREKGIGAGIAAALSRNGARVVINYVSDSTAPRAAEVVKRIESLGGRAVAIQADISTPGGANKLVDDTLKAFGAEHIDILVNNAATGFPGPAMKASKESIERTFAVNVYGPLFLIQAVVPTMPRGGRIINIGSIGSKLGTPEASIHMASKAAMDALTFAMAKELGRGYGITINTVAPGPVPTESLPPQVEEAIHAALIPLTRAEDRVGSVDDIADVVLLLASEKSRWLTGQYISASGGITGA
ncbi:putative short-chain dehydrogenase [Coniochaeta sp. PMI_546]|nr:putative short-chain dehydrogenase [Coniochaeta sp. PMI_546]